MEHNRKSKMWHIGKKRWLNGPNIPNNYYFIYASANAINKTHVIIVGANVDQDAPSTAYMFGADLETYISLMYDFKLNSWSKLPRLPIKYALYTCFLRVPISSEIFMDKMNNK